MNKPKLSFVDKLIRIFNVSNRGCRFCKKNGEKTTIVHNRYGNKVFSNYINYCFYCGRKLK